MPPFIQNRYVDSFTRLSLLPNPFPREEERTIMAFCKGAEMVKEVQDAGATIVGGTDLIKKIQVNSTAYWPMIQLTSTAI